MNSRNLASQFDPSDTGVKRLVRLNSGMGYGWRQPSLRPATRVDLELNHRGSDASGGVPRPPSPRFSRLALVGVAVQASMSASIP